MGATHLLPPRRFTLSMYVRSLRTASGSKYEYPWSTASADGYRALTGTAFRVNQMTVLANLSGFSSGENFQVGFFKDSFSSAFMLVESIASGDVRLTDVTTVTEFSGSEDFCCRIAANHSFGTNTATDITVIADCEYI